MNDTLKTTQGTKPTVEVSPTQGLPTLPTKVITSDWYTSTINNTTLKNVGGDNWNMYLFECYDSKKKEYNVELLKGKVNMLKSFGKRPPSSNGVGNNGVDFSDVMKKTKQEIITLIKKNSDSNDCFVGNSGKLYKIQNPFFREYVMIDGKPKMKTLVKKGTTTDFGKSV